MSKILTPCPINTEVGYYDKCPVHQCQYNLLGECAHKAMSEVDPKIFLESHDKLVAAQRSAKRIKAYVYIDQYMMFTLNKSLMQVTEEEARSVMLSDRFYAWPNAKEETFWVMEAVFKEMFIPRRAVKKNMVDSVRLNPTFRIQVEAALRIRA